MKGGTFFDRLDDEGDGVRVDGCVAMALYRQQHSLLQQRLHELRWQDVSFRHRLHAVGIHKSRELAGVDAEWELSRLAVKCFPPAESSDCLSV
jgi:hypothetical protein